MEDLQQKREAPTVNGAWWIDGALGFYISNENERIHLQKRENNAVLYYRNPIPGNPLSPSPISSNG